jgi:3-oxoacyl-[acyl-carrier protein] reductase
VGTLRNKVAVVTGASKGIGAAIAVALGAAGAAVALNYASDAEGAARAVAKVKSIGGRAIAIQGDVSKATDVKRIFATTREAFGRLDILVNNAGVYKLFPLEELTEAEFQRIFGINVFGLLQATREAAAHFGPEGGSVINIGAAVTSLKLPNASLYAGSKGAVDVITGVLANELAPRKIRVNSINPGGVETEGWLALGVKGTPLGDEMIARTPLGRLGHPDDIAKIATFLASSDSGWLTGEVLLASGGQR